MEFVVGEAQPRKVIEALSPIIGFDPDKIVGVVVVLQAVDGSYGLMHNCCCIGHAREIAVDACDHYASMLPTAHTDN